MCVCVRVVVAAALDAESVCGVLKPLSPTELVEHMLVIIAIWSLLHVADY